MRMIISPAKQMLSDDRSLPPSTTPMMLEDARFLRDCIRRMSFEAQERMWGCSKGLAERSAAEFEALDFDSALTPALLAFDGIQYKYMAPSVFEDGQIGYVQDHLRIISGLFGMLRPLDGVQPYRLEMQAKGLPIGAARAAGPFGHDGSMCSKGASCVGKGDLYAFWADSIYEAVMDGNEDRTIINIASKEYSKAIERYLQPSDRYVTFVFGDLIDGRVVQKGVYVKMARGEMVRYLASIEAEDPEQAKGFDWSDYSYDDELSDDSTYTFIRR